MTEDAHRIHVAGPALEAAIRKEGYVSGVEGGSLLDKKTGSRDLGFGLDIVDWLMEPGSDEDYRDKLPGDLPYTFNNLVHGKRPKRSIEGPQICTKAGMLAPRVINGPDFVAIRQDFTYRLAAPGKVAGSKWEQTIVFPEGRRYFLSADKITSANDSIALFLRVDMPGHIKHRDGDTFSEVYLSYHGTVEAGEFVKDFPPDRKYLYVREPGKAPRRFIRAYHLRDPRTGKDGPWLAGMTLDPSVVSEAWCHQRGYVCLIEEIGGRPIKAGDTFGAEPTSSATSTRSPRWSASTTSTPATSASPSTTGAGASSKRLLSRRRLRPMGPPSSDRGLYLRSRRAGRPRRRAVEVAIPHRIVIAERGGDGLHPRRRFEDLQRPALDDADRVAPFGVDQRRVGRLDDAETRAENPSARRDFERLVDVEQKGSHAPTARSGWLRGRAVAF